MVDQAGRDAVGAEPRRGLHTEDDRCGRGGVGRRRGMPDCGDGAPWAARRLAGAGVDEVVPLTAAAHPAPGGGRGGRQAPLDEVDHLVGTVVERSGGVGDPDRPGQPPVWRELRRRGGTDIPADADDDGDPEPRDDTGRDEVGGIRLAGGAEVEGLIARLLKPELNL